MMKEIIQIAIVDDHELFREGLKLLLSQIKECHVCCEAENGKVFIEEHLPECTVDIVLMDINMPVLSGIETTQRLSITHPGIRVIALTMHKEETYYMQMIQAGAKGFVLKKSGKYVLKQAIFDVYSVGSYFSQEILQKLTFKLTHPGETMSQSLTEREKEILVLICKGLSSNEIAEKLFISPKTVEVHRTNIFRKANVKNTARLVIWAIKNKIYEVF